MKITMPENLATPFAMLMKGIPEELQADKKFKDAVLVFLKMGGVSMARRFVDTRIRYLGYDPLEIDTGFRFPRLQETESEEDSTDQENGEEKEEGEEDEDQPADEAEDEDA